MDDATLTPSLLEKLAILDKYTVEQLDAFFAAQMAKRTRKETNHDYYTRHKEELKERNRQRYYSKKGNPEQA